MALIPGTLPSDTCYGTPQDLLELFAQYLDIPAVALQSKVFFSTIAPTDTASIWVDTTTAVNPILKLYVGGSWVEYPLVGTVTTANQLINGKATVTTPASGDFLLISQSGILKKIAYSNLAPTPAAGSITYPMLSTSATEADNVDKRVAKAWVNFNGTGTVAIREDFNVSSIGDNATGHFTINFSSALSDANYCVVVSGMRNAPSPTGNDSMVGAIATYTTYGSAFKTTACEIVTRISGSIADDPLAATAAIFR